MLEAFWNAREIAGVSLVDIGAWRWLYAHPDATPAEFREAVVQLAQEVWNRYYAPLLGTRDVTLLAIYSHMVNNEMYTPDYPLAHLVAFQIRAALRQVGRPAGQGVRARGADRRGHAERMDAPGRRRAPQRDPAPPGCGEGAGAGEVKSVFG